MMALRLKSRGKSNFSFLPERCGQRLRLPCFCINFRHRSAVTKIVVRGEDKALLIGWRSFRMQKLDIFME